MEYPSKLIEEAVTEISRLPGIGRKTAFRLALHLLKQDSEYTHRLAESLLSLRDNIKKCRTCHMLSDTEDCTCIQYRKDPTTLCVVEDTPDVMAIQNTAQYHGYFHVLGGVISPLEGVGPGDLTIESLINRIANPDSQIEEVILALSATMEGDTTSFYIARKLKPYNVRITALARGVPVGGELEYTDEITLGRSIVKRMTYETGE
jgi:recombination protein RecR